MRLRTCTQTKIRTLWNVTLLGAWLWDVSFNNANNVQIRPYAQWEFQSFFSSQKDVCSAGKQGHSSLRFKQNIYLPLLPQFGQNYQISQALSACLSSRYWIIYFKFAHFDQSCETLRPQMQLRFRSTGWRTNHMPQLTFAMMGDIASCLRDSMEFFWSPQSL